MSKELPKVSIMIPTYGQEQYIVEAVNSACNQDYENLEIIVSDDCSPDQTEEVIKNIKDNRIVYHRNKSNLGRVGNYHNTAHNLASGKWAINLDGDDYFTSGSFITDAMQAIIETGNDKIVAYCYRHTNLDKIKQSIPFKEIDENRIIVSGKDYFLNYYKVGNFGHPNTIFRRDIGVSIGLYTLPHQACDFHSIIRIFLLGDIILDRRSVAYWRVHGENTTILEVQDKQHQAMLTFDAIEDFAKGYCTTEELKPWRKKMNDAAFVDYICTYVSINRNIKGAKMLLLNPRLKRWYFSLWYKFILKH